MKGGEPYLIDVILSNQTYMQIAFGIFLTLALLTLPLRDIITIGFFDISDLFVSCMITFFIAYMVNEAMSGSTYISGGLFSLIFISVVTGVVLLNIFVIIPPLEAVRKTQAPHPSGNSKEKKERCRFLSPNMVSVKLLSTRVFQKSIKWLKSMKTKTISP
ncbi:MAG: hypothetical protein U5K84_14550 [Alkalibacterium sp.]|nr:hypothetical protein [Alkalibacterium sp.]